MSLQIDELSVKVKRILREKGVLKDESMADRLKYADTLTRHSNAQTEQFVRAGRQLDEVGASLLALVTETRRVQAEIQRDLGKARNGNGKP